MNIVHADALNYMNCLVFGPSGNGKTFFLGTAQDDPRTSPGLFLDWEGGVSTLKDRPDLDIIKITKWDDFKDVISTLRGGNHDYKSILVDSITEANIGSLLSQLDGSRKRAIENLLEPGDYGIALVLMRRLLRDLRDLPIHFFATALSMTDTDPRIGAVQKPSLVGALKDEAPGIFDAVTYLAITEKPAEAEYDTNPHVLVLQNVPQFRTKVRVPASIHLPDTIEGSPTVSIGMLLDAVGIK